MNFTGYMPQFGIPDCQGPMEADDTWEAESQASVVQQSTHEISEDEDDLDSMSVRSAPVASALDFSALPSGKFAELLKAQHAKVKEEDRVGPSVGPHMASILTAFFDDTKVAGELDKLVKEYPRIKNVEKQVVPKIGR